MQAGAAIAMTLGKEMKNSRGELLEQFAWRTRPRKEIFAELEEFGWDSDIDHFTVPAAAVINVINLTIAGTIAEEELIEWALFFECREDITYEDGDQKDLSEIVWLLANPEINYKLTHDFLKTLATRCEAIKKKPNKAEMATPRKPSD